VVIKRKETDMKKFEINVDINGTFTFEVEAKNKNEAQRKVDDILSDTSVKEALEKYRNNIVLNQRVKQEKEMER
jgi:hypothetical protein